MGLFYGILASVVFFLIFCPFGIWKEFCPYKFCKTLLIFYTIVVIKVLLNLALGKSSFSRSPVLRQLLPNMLYTEWTLVFIERTN